MDWCQWANRKRYSCYHNVISFSIIELGNIGTPATIASPSTRFKATLNKNMVVDYKFVLSIVNSGAAQILDARSRARFLGYIFVDFRLFKLAFFNIIFYFVAVNTQLYYFYCLFSVRSSTGTSSWTGRGPYSRIPFLAIHFGCN